MSEEIIRKNYPQFKSEFAEVNNIKLHYVKAGPEDGELIIFLHGFPQFWYMWSIAYPFANLHPNLLEKLIIINAPHPNIFVRLIQKNKDQQSSSQYVLFFRSQNAEGYLSANNYKFLLDVITTPEMEFTEDDKQMYVNAWAQPGALTGGLNYYRAGGLRPPSQGEKIDEMTLNTGLDPVMINVPTLVIWAEKDTALTVHNLEGLDEFVPDLAIKRIPEGSHWVINEQPERVNKLIREFI